jgi:hypothetical protein
MCCTGKEVGYTDLKTEEQKKLLQQLIAGTSSGLVKGATKYPGQIAAGIDPLMKMAANIMSNYGSGKNYTGTPTSGMPSNWYGGGGPYKATTNMGYPGDWKGPLVPREPGGPPNGPPTGPGGAQQYPPWRDPGWRRQPPSA